jgi:iron complex outermembrane receptor protein
MTSNRSTQLNARYRGQYDWGELQAQAYSQRTDHRMDMGPDRDTTAPACPWTRPAARWGPRCRPA